MRRALALPALAMAGALALGACSTRAPESSGGGGGAGGASGSADPSAVETDFGVTESEITLGALTDNSGVFKDLGISLIQGHQLAIDEINEAGGICERDLALEVRDHGYKADTAVIQYPELEPNVLGFMQILGSPVNAALDQELIDNETTGVALSWSSQLLDNPYVIIPGTTYDVEMINGLSYLLEQGRIKSGDKIGHIYIDGEYGGNGLLGSKYFAEQNGITLVEAKVTSADADMTNIVTGFRGEGVTAIALTTTPAQTASAAAANAALGLNVPLVGNNPTFAPQLLATPAAPALANLYVVASAVPYSSDVPKAAEVRTAWEATGAQELPSAGVQYGYAIGQIWAQLLQIACDNGDLTRAGIQEALQSATDITTDELVADLDFSSPGAPATREVYVAQPDPAADGGLRQVEPLFVSPDAESYQAPFQQ